MLQAIDLKLELVSKHTYGVLETAALIGERFHYDLLAAVADQPDSMVAHAIDEALEGRLIRADGARAHQYTFDHALVREGLLSRQPLARRRQGHIRMAEALIRKLHPDIDSVALHLSLASDGRAVEWLLLAGDRALRLGATAQARQRYERALELLDGPDARRGELLLKLGHAIAYHDGDQAWEHWQSALQAASEADDEVVQVWCQHFLLKEMFRRVDVCRGG